LILILNYSHGFLSPPKPNTEGERIKKQGVLLITRLDTDLHIQTGTCSKNNYKSGDYLGVSRK